MTLITSQNCGRYRVGQRGRVHEAAVFILFRDRIRPAQLLRQCVLVDQLWRGLWDQIFDIAIGADIYSPSSPFASSHHIKPACNEARLPRIQPIAREIDVLREGTFEYSRRAIGQTF